MKITKLFFLGLSTLIFDLSVSRGGSEKRRSLALSKKSFKDSGSKRKVILLKLKKMVQEF